VSIEVQSVTKRYGRHAAVSDVSLRVERGELVALLGPSGSGKTTLLRVIAGLEAPDAGAVRIADRDTTTQGVRERNVGFVFQHYALFRHMSVFENVAFGLRVRPRRVRPGHAEIARRVEELLKLVQLEAFANRYPSQLSGGQRQRVALARALAVEPDVLLLDEPFGALDAKVRKELRRWLRRLHQEVQVTSMFVTHDQEEALELADRVVIMNNGVIEQVGTPEDVYAKPRTAFVCDFLGDVNLFHSRIESGTVRVGDLAVDVPDLAHARSDRARVYIRPHMLTVRSEAAGTGHVFAADVVHVNAAGPLVRLELHAAWGDPVRVEMTQDRYRELQLEDGMRVFVSFDPSEVLVLPEEQSGEVESEGSVERPHGVQPAAVQVLRDPA
jgi:sulfate/thiosulfate transport system ATP-binding protein